MKRLSSLVVILASILTACTAPTTQGGPSATPAPSVAQVLVSKDRDEFGTTDPANVSSNGDANVEFNITSALVRLKPGTTEIVPDLAEKWTVSPDGLKYTFNLRHGVKWQKGFGDFTAKDVVYSYTRIMDPKTASRYRGDFAAVKSVEAPDDYTVVINFSRPSPGFFYSVLTYRPGFIAKKEAIEQFGKDYGRNAVGTGPYILDSVTPGVGWVLVINPEYWGPKPTLTRIEYKLIKDENVAALALEKGELDAAYFENPETQLKVRSLANVTVSDAPMPRTFHMHMNIQRSPLSDVKVRQALAWAVNKQGIVDHVFQGQAKVAGSMIPPGFIGHVDDTSIGYDLNKAKQLLAEAGYPNGFPGKTFEFLVIDAAPSPDILQVMQADWAKIGFQTKAEVLDIAAFNARRMANTFDIMMLPTLRAESSQFIGQYLHSRSIPFENITGYRGADALIEQSESELDPVKRQALYEQLQKVIMRDLPIYPIAYPLQVLATKKNVKGAAIGLLNLPLYQMSRG